MVGCTTLGKKRRKYNSLGSYIGYFYYGTEIVECFLILRMLSLLRDSIRKNVTDAIPS
jgi:hypothetical protein